MSLIKPKPGDETILAEAVEIDSEIERTSFVERACAGDEVLRKEVQRLIGNHLRAGCFLESPAVNVAATIDSSHVCETVGNRIGPYKLRELLGEGGMGSVFVAEQEKPVRRKVALKIIKPGTLSEPQVGSNEDQNGFRWLHASGTTIDSYTNGNESFAALRPVYPGTRPKEGSKRSAFLGSCQLLPPPGRAGRKAIRTCYLRPHWTRFRDPV